MQDGNVMLPKRITHRDLNKLCLSCGGVTKGVHYERHLVFTITADSTHESSALPRTDITCFRCGEKGHKKGECRTYRTKMCRQPTNCSDPHCPFAHTHLQLRTPWIARCIRIVRKDGQLMHIGCGRTGHTYRECPYDSSSRVGEEMKDSFSQGILKEVPCGMGGFKTAAQWDRYIEDVDKEESDGAPSPKGVLAALMDPSHDHQKLSEVAEKLSGPAEDPVPPPPPPPHLGDSTP